MNFVGISEFEPSHQGLDFLFRPPLIPGIYGIELSILGSNWITYTPILLIITTLWQMQHLSERWTTKARAMFVIPAFLLLPSVRYWGQLQLLDVPVAGMYILIIHLLIKSDENTESKSDAIILGLCSGLIFLTKYVYVYLIGICVWLAIKDKNIRRSKLFFSGWVIITLPFLVYHLIKYGDPLEALTPQSSFALGGLTQTLGEYSFEKWWIDYNLEITGIGIFASLIGIVVLFFRDCSQFVSVLVIGTPFVIIHGLILDFGTPRYQIPFFALSIVLISSTLPIRNLSNSSDYNKIKTLLGTFGITVLLFFSMIHVGTLEEEKGRYDILQTLMDDRMQFYLNSSEMFPDEEYTLTSKYIPIALHTGKYTARYLYTSDSLTDSLESSEINYALTSNYYPYRSWEKDFKPFFGNQIVEPVDHYQDSNGLSVLWEKGDEPWSNYTINFDTNGTIYGNMLELKPNEVASFAYNQTIFFVKSELNQTIEYSIMHYIERTLDENLGNCDFVDISGYCNTNDLDVVNQYEHILYIWTI
ncbi:MAG: glycosyltransferase family 39 protein [Candidatus Poseidoniales archaeon]|nr:glycosyltransferase family 39 protein [Candidatus Poseidoniales archaeon]